MAEPSASLMVVWQRLGLVDGGKVIHGWINMDAKNKLSPVIFWKSSLISEIYLMIIFLK